MNQLKVQSVFSPLLSLSFTTADPQIDCRIYAAYPSAPNGIVLPSYQPHFDQATGRLSFGGQVIRTYSRRATNCFPVLRAFEELNWPPCIDDPLSGGKNSARLNNTVRTLKTNLRLIEFYAAGDGASFGWRPL